MSTTANVFNIGNIKQAECKAASSLYTHFIVSYWMQILKAMFSHMSIKPSPDMIQWDVLAPYRGGRCEICVCSGVEGGGYQGHVKWNDKETDCSLKIWAGQQPLNLRKYLIYESPTEKECFHSFSFVSFPPFFSLLCILFQETARKESYSFCLFLSCCLISSSNLHSYLFFLPLFAFFSISLLSFSLFFQPHFISIVHFKNSTNSK